MAVRLSFDPTALADQADMAEPNDASLLQAMASQRDRAAFNTLCERYQERAYNFAFRILRNADRAEDAVQEAMLAIWLTPATALPQGKVENWIMGIIIHKSIDLKRSRTQSDKREEQVGSVEREQQPLPVDAAAKEELISALRKHIDRLPELECDLLTCCYGANMTHQSISEAFQLPRSSVTEKIQSALAQLRVNLKRAGFAVVALNSTEAISEATRTGFTFPPGMTARILNNLDGATKHVARGVSRRGVQGAARHASQATLSGAWGTAIGGLLIVAAITVYLLTRNPAGENPAAKPAADTPTQANATPKPAAPQPTAIKWDFEAGLGAEFSERSRVVGDETRKDTPLPTWLAPGTGGQERSGVLEFPRSGASLFLKTGVPRRLPIRFEFDLWVLDPQKISIGIWSGRKFDVPDRAASIVKFQKAKDGPGMKQWAAGSWIRVVRSISENHGIVTTRTTYDGNQGGDYLQEKKLPAWGDPNGEEYFEIYGMNFLIDNLRITYGN